MKEMFDIFNFYKSNYKMLFSYRQDDKEEQVISDKTKEFCRFCGRCSPEVSFEKKAHAISELLGNKYIFLENECDDCNAFFGKKLENYLANYLGLSRTLSQVHGKKGVPSYKSRDGKSRIDFTDKGLVIQGKEDSTFMEIDENNKKIIFHCVRDSYIPIAVYKSLVKISLSLIDYSEIKYFKDTIDWIKEDSHDNSKYDMSNYAYIIEKFIPGPNPMGLNAIAYRRIHDCPSVPYYIFQLEFTNYIYQIAVPSKEKDAIFTNTDIKQLPTKNEIDNRTLLTFYRRNMISYDIVKNEAIDLCMGFESAEIMESDGRSINEVFEEKGINLKKRL